ncbi:DUF2500 domain-containing protein [Vibrio sp. WXL103]|uniref:DUF2500 domain-containing protein n=1 Tax=Vibrio sp. WXL103 TaxID=3450710 RepID=UPI003EC6B75E
MPTSLFLIMGLLAAIAAWLCWRLTNQHLQGTNAEKKTIEVIVLDKQAFDVALESLQVGQEAQEYWIYVQKGHLGPKREFQVGVHYYHALNPGDKGSLTYQGDKFVHFALTR